MIYDILKGDIWHRHSMELLSGKPVAERIDMTVRSLIGDLRPKLIVYLIGADPSSVIYAGSKVRKGDLLGIEILLREFKEDSDPEEIRSSLRKDASDGSAIGIMIERPLPDRFDMDELMEMVPPEKDVEGLHPENIGLLCLGRPRFIPPTPLGALFMLLHYDVEIKGKDVVVVGRSPNVGRPLTILLSLKREWGNATVTNAHSRTRDLKGITRRSDIILTAVGEKGLITGDMVKEGAVLIDLGINPVEGGIVGDVDIGSLESSNSRATPTPGGTGPVTVSCMFLNLAISMTRANGSFPELEDLMIREIYG